MGPSASMPVAPQTALNAGSRVERTGLAKSRQQPIRKGSAWVRKPTAMPRLRFASCCLCRLLAAFLTFIFFGWPKLRRRQLLSSSISFSRFSISLYERSTNYGSGVRENPRLGNLNLSEPRTRVSQESAGLFPHSSDQIHAGYKNPQPDHFYTIISHIYLPVRHCTPST